MTQEPSDTGVLSTYKPLFIIVGLILLVSVFATAQEGGAKEFMQNFMAGFFLVFSGLKLLDVAGFARGYAKYDLLAARMPLYGYVYPFIELSLGLLYLSYGAEFSLNIFTMILMIFSGIGVTIKVLKKEQFQCACLGTMIKVPLTRITIIEDFGMAAMAGLMLFVK